MNGRHDDSAEPAGALNHQPLALDRVRAEREVLAMPFQRTQRKVGDRPCGQALAEFMRQQLRVKHLLRFARCGAGALD